MITIHADLQPGDSLIRVSGHADSAPHGYDKVCAAVSGVLQMAVLGLEQIATHNPDFVKVTINHGKP